MVVCPPVCLSVCLSQVGVLEMEEWFELVLGTKTIVSYYFLCILNADLPIVYVRPIHQLQLHPMAQGSR